MNTSPTSD